MIRRRLMLGLLLVLATVTFGQGFRERTLVPLATLEGVSFGPESGVFSTIGADHFVVDDEGRVIVWDKYNEELDVFSLSGEPLAQVSFDGSPDPLTDSSYSMSIDQGRILIDTTSGWFHVVQLSPLEGQLSFRLTEVLRGGPRLDRDAVWIGNMIVAFERDTRYVHTFEIVETEDGLDYIYRNPRETIIHIRENYEGQDEFWLDRDRNLFYGQRFVTANPEAFNEYHARRSADYIDPIEMMSTSDTIFVGSDREGHQYWESGVWVSVYSADGRLVHTMRVPIGDDRGRLQIDSFGNVYALSYGGVVPGELSLLWIERDW